MNFRKFTKKDWQWAYDHRCREHNRRYTEHPACLEAEYPDIDTPSGIKEKIGFLDVETQLNFNANFSVMLTWAIKPLEGKTVSDSLTEKDFAEHRKNHTLFHVDTRLVQHLVDEVSRYDRIITHYGRKFDIPFMRTRALINKIEFPHFQVIVNDDVYYWARYKLKLNSNRLETVVKTLTGHSDKTHLDAEVWIPAGMGDMKCIGVVLEHNLIDVNELKEEYLILKDFVGHRNTSI